MKEEMIGFFRGKIDGVTVRAGVIWGFEPMRDEVNTGGGTTGDSEDD